MRLSIYQVPAVLLAVFGLLASVSPAAGQTFSRVDQGPIVTNVNVSLGASWGDANNDGYLDLYVANSPTSGENSNQRNGLFLNNGDGSFFFQQAWALVSDRSPTQSSVWVDYNGDGLTDLYVSNASGTRGSTGNALYRNDGNGDFSLVVGGDLPDIAASVSSSWSDYDRDGDLDLFVTDNFGTAFELLRADGGDVFTQVPNVPSPGPPPSGRAAVWMDYDDDGDEDLFTIGFAGPGGTGNPNRLYRNMLEESGAATFEEDTAVRLVSELGVANFMGVSLADVDTDGDLDVYFTTGFGGSKNPLYLNQGNGLYSDAVFGPLSTSVSGRSTGACWGDYDNDGDLDVFVSTNPFFRLEGFQDGFFLNDGEGRFTQRKDAHPAADLTIANGCANGDIDNDGDLDLFVATGNNFTVNAGSAAPEENVLYRNEDGNQLNWINLTMQGVTSNRAAIGTRVSARVTIAGREATQVRWVSGGPTGDRSQNSSRVHFGLGDAEAITELVVEWPSGVTERFTDVRANRFLTVVEGQPLATATEAVPAPTFFSLLRNYPNPFTGKTQIVFHLDRSSHVSLTVFDLLGREVASLLDGPLEAGTHTLPFAPEGMESGVLFFRLVSGIEVQSRAMLLVK